MQEKKGGPKAAKGSREIGERNAEQIDERDEAQRSDSLA
jgi:hypothetical protein